MNERDIGWLAGLFEGEGSTGVYGGGVSVYIGMTDLDVLLRVETLFPSPAGVRVRERKAGRKLLYEWTLNQRDLVAEFLELILPMLGERRKAQAAPVIARASDPLGGLGSGHRRKTHCRHGHPYDEANTHIDAQGHRGCRTCRRAQAAARRKTS